MAPLGTAVTPEQLALLWRVADEPVVALDGDKAGLKAAMRLLDLALPMLEAGRTLLFALMPAGMDPDDLIRAEGPAAVARRIEAAEPLVEMLWRRETEDAVLDSPERRAAFDQRLRDALGRIRDEQVRYHYSEAIKERRAALFRPAGFAEARALPFRGRIGKGVPAGPTPGLKESRLAQGDAAAADEARIAVILAALLRHPGLIIEFEDALDRLDPRGEALRAVREALLRHAAEGEGDPASAISRDHLEKLFRTGHVRRAPVVASEDPDHVRLVVGDALRMLAARRGAEAEIEDAVRVLGGAETGGGDEGVTWRLGQAAEALSGRAGGADEDRREYDTGPNGARMAKDERDAFRRLLGGIVYGEDRGRKR